MTTLVQDRRISVVLAISFIVVSILTLARFNQSLWIDEAASIWFARLPIDKLFTSICEPVTPIYHLMLKAFLAVSDTEAWLRLPSLAAGLLAVFFTYRLGVEICSKRCAGLAAILLALQPLHSWYAGEIRMHALGESLGVLAVWLGYRVIASPPTRAVTRRDWVIYILVAALALWVDYTTLLAWGLLQLIWIAKGRPNAWRWIGAQSIILLLIVPGITQNQLIALNSNLYPIFLAIRANQLGIQLTPATASSLLLLTATGGILICLGSAVYWRHRKLDESSLVQWIVIGLWIGLVVWSILPQAYTLKRRLVVALPYLALATAYFTLLAPRKIMYALLALGGAAAIISVVTLQREPWRSVVQDVLTARVQLPAVAWVDEMAVPSFDYYWRRAGLPSESLQWTTLFGRTLPEIPQLAPPPNGTLWVILAESPYRKLIPFLPSQFFADYQLVSERHESGIGVYRYQRRTQPDPTALPRPDRTPADEWGLLLRSPLDACTP